jgi:hypothetical protein
VPQVHIDPAVLPDAFNANIPLARTRRCQAPLKDLPEERVRNVLAAAAQFRLRQKAARIRHKIDSRGRDEVLFSEAGSCTRLQGKQAAFHADHATTTIEVAARSLPRTLNRCYLAWQDSCKPRSRCLQKIDTRICASAVGPLVAASRRVTAVNFTRQNLATQQHAGH